MAHLQMLQGDFGGFAVDRFEHSLQTATRAFKDGKDEEYIVCVLLHDIGDLLGTFNHAELGAVILKPFISEQNHFMLQNHGIFQAIISSTISGLTATPASNSADMSILNIPRNSATFTIRPPLTRIMSQCRWAFEPMVRKVMERPRNSIYIRDDETSAI